MRDRAKAAARALRNARYYRSKRDGLMCVAVEVDAQVLSFILKLCWLTETGATSAEKIAEAIRDGLKLSARAAAP
jgi:hypothetical protein